MFLLGFISIFGAEHTGPLMGNYPRCSFAGLPLTRQLGEETEKKESGTSFLKPIHYYYFPLQTWPHSPRRIVSSPRCCHYLLTICSNYKENTLPLLGKTTDLIPKPQISPGRTT